MKNGDLVFFKKAKRSTHRKSEEVAFKGHAFGVMLGHVPPFAKDPAPEHLLRLMGTVGFISFDDIGEFLSEEQAQLIITKFEDKYYGKVAEENAPEVAPAPSSLVDATGNAILPNGEMRLVDPVGDFLSDKNPMRGLDL